jgi:hypothetical protein
VAELESKLAELQSSAEPCRQAPESGDASGEADEPGASSGGQGVRGSVSPFEAVAESVEPGGGSPAPPASEASKGRRSQSDDGRPLASEEARSGRLAEAQAVLQVSVRLLSVHPFSTSYHSKCVSPLPESVRLLSVRPFSSSFHSNCVSPLPESVA